MTSEKEIMEKLDILVKERALEIESELREQKEENARLEKRGERYIEKTTKIFKKNRINIDSILAIGKEEAKLALKDIDEMKEKLKIAKKHHNGGSPQLLQNIVLPAYHVLLFCNRTITRGATATPIDRNYGGQLDVGPLESVGEGWGIFSRAFPRIIVDRYFVFIPFRGGYYNFTVYQEYFGYCIVQAFDDWTSKYAQVKVQEKIRVTQDDRFHESNYVDLQVGADSINIRSIVSKTSTNRHTELLRVGEPAYVLVSQEFDAYARGEGSYAWLDFAGYNIDDNNYVAEPIVTFTYTPP